MEHQPDKFASGGGGDEGQMMVFVIFIGACILWERVINWEGEQIDVGWYKKKMGLFCQNILIIFVSKSFPAYIMRIFLSIHISLDISEQAGWILPDFK